ncbi:MAG: hypothetical protein P8177_09735, partial [Gemmatimonadota bacterium]
LEEHVSPGIAITVYCDLLDMRPTVGEIVRLKTLKVLHDRVTGAVKPIRPDGPVPLRRRAQNSG